MLEASRISMGLLVDSSLNHVYASIASMDTTLALQQGLI